MDIETLKFFNNLPKLVDLTLAVVKLGGSDGLDEWTIDWNVGLELGLPEHSLEEVLNHVWVIERLEKARQKLKDETLIGFNSKTKVWYPQRSKEYTPSIREQKFIERRVGRGWRRIWSKLDAIEWLYTNLSPDEFEYFCSAILTQHCRVPVEVTTKRRYSGADGGFDGTGTCNIEGKHENVAVQAKRYALSGQVSQDHCQKFIGALIENEMNHGFIITTGIFSDRARQTVEKVKKQNIWIELIDQQRLADIMLEKSNLPHGFGLYRTDIDWLYINEQILRAAGTEPSIKRKN